MIDYHPSYGRDRIDQIANDLIRLAEELRGTGAELKRDIEALRKQILGNAELKELMGSKKP